MTQFQKRSPAIVLLLSLVTCGIYSYYLIYKICTEIRDFKGDSSINPGIELLLCIVTCGLYTIYWYYKYGEMVADMQTRTGVPDPHCNPIILLILPFFGIGCISLMLLQSELNRVWDIVSPEGGSSAGSASFTASAPPPPFSSADAGNNTASGAGTTAQQQTPPPSGAAPFAGTQESAPAGNTCPSCGQPVPKEAKFCPVCGHTMTEDKICPICGQKIPAGAKFCPGCGTKNE